MNPSGQPKHPIILIKRLESKDNLIINLQSITKIMVNHLNSITTRSHDFETILKKQNLKQLIETYSQVVIQIRQQKKQSQDVYLNHLHYYKQLIYQKQEKIKHVNQEIISAWKTISNREEQISENESQIFKLKFQIQQKEKQILQLLIRLQKKGSVEPQKNIENIHKNQIKIVVNEPIKKAPQREESVIQQHQDKMQRKENSKQWVEERKNLLKVLKQKDLKIYHLIQELNERKQQK